MTIETSIILPVWNRADLTMQFLNEHWQLYSRRDDLEIVIVDNGSTDLTQVVLEKWEKTLSGKIQVIRNVENRGFAAGNNQGARAAKGNVLIFISNDVVAGGDYVTEIERWLSVGSAISTDMIAAADTPTITWRLGEKNDILLGAELLSHDTGWNLFNSPQGEIIIPYLAGWCIACNRQTWEILGGWDERYYPSDYEDIDLSYTAAQKGIQRIAIKLPLRHISGQSAMAIKGGRLTVTNKNRKLFMEKWGLTDAAAH